MYVGNLRHLANEMGGYSNIPVVLRRRSPTLPAAQIALVSHGAADGTVTLPQGRDLGEIRDLRMTLSVWRPPG